MILNFVKTEFLVGGTSPHSSWSLKTGNSTLSLHIIMCRLCGEQMNRQMGGTCEDTGLTARHTSVIPLRTKNPDNRIQLMFQAGLRIWGPRPIASTAHLGPVWVCNSGKELWLCREALTMVHGLAVSGMETSGGRLSGGPAHQGEAAGPPSSIGELRSLKSSRLGLRSAPLRPA